MILYGFTSMRGSTISTRGTASLIASPSRSETPSDFLRSSARSSGFTVFARTMTLRRPRRPIASSAFFSPPALIESIAITALTPKIIPSIVSAVRSLCVARFCSAVVKVSVLRIFVLGGIAQRDLVAFRQALRHDDAARGRRPDLDRDRVELVAVLAVDELFSLLLKDGLARDREGAVAILDVEHGANAGSRLHQRRIGVVERDRGAEVLHRHARKTGARQLVDL